MGLLFLQLEDIMAEQAAPTYVIIGNGIAGATAAEILRAEDSAATIAMIADEPIPVYYRPALKDYLGGRINEDKLWARPTSFYQDQAIRFLPERVIGIQPAQHSLQLQSGRQLGYDRLLLANGARPARLNCPGLQFDGVYTLRNVADYQALLEQLNKTRRVVVVGSGTLALETIETLRHRNYDITHIVRRNTIWSEVLDMTASDLVLQQERRDGVDVRLEEEVVEIIGKQGLVSGVVTKRGEQIACETVIIAIGIEPIIDFIKKSGIACGRGVRVDEQMRTNAPDIYAAGDVLETKDTMTGRTRVIGQWYPAIQQARAAAYSMLDLLDDKRLFSASTFYNATFLYGLDFASVGITNAPGFQEIVAEPKARTYRKVLLKEGVPVGMLALGDRKQVLAFKRAIDHRVNLQSVASTLFTDNFKLSAWLDSQGVPPALLGASRQGDVAMKRAAYADSAPVAGNMTSGQQPLTEALLVPIDTTSNMPTEIRLSQTKMMTVGRQAGVFLLIDEATVSRRHAEISWANGQYILLDLGSSNGTFVNNVRLEPTSTYVLKANDIVLFGKVAKYNFIVRVVNGQVKRLPVSSPSLVDVTRMDVKIIAGDANKLGQPILNADGSLLLPGATMPLPAAVVATLKNSAALVVLTGDMTSDGKRPPMIFMLKEGKSTIIGREENVDIKLADPVVSRQHAEVFPSPTGCYIRDLGSSNGLMINQVKIGNAYHLSHNDCITLGGSVLYFVDLRAMPDVTFRAQAMDPPRAPIIAAASSIQPRGVAQVINGQADKRVSSKLATVPELVVCNTCGGVNTRIARFCASCSAPLGVMK